MLDELCGDPMGAVTVKTASVPQGQGHRTVLAQVVGDILGLPLGDVRAIVDVDTSRDSWSIAAGNYSSRFAAAVAGAVSLAAIRLRDKLARIAAEQFRCDPQNIEFANRLVFDRTNPDVGISFARLAGVSHWAPGTLPDAMDQAISETVFWSPPELTAPNEKDEVNSSLCHGFIFDFCGLEIDRQTGEVRIDRYVSMHDCGRILHPGMVDGQVRGAFLQAVGAALYEEFAYAEDGSFESGTLADYLIPTVMETPELQILHFETPSPFTPLGAKGVAEGNCMSTPVCIANAVADALSLEEITLPITPSKILAMIGSAERPPSNPIAKPLRVAAKPGERAMTGEGQADVPASREAVWKMLLEAETLAAVIPGAHGVHKVSPEHFTATVTLGVGPVKDRYEADVKLSDINPLSSVTLTGTVVGRLGSGGGTGTIQLTDLPDGGTRLHYSYVATVGGKVASVGGRLLDGAARVIIGQFFQSLARHAGGGAARGSSWLGRLLNLVRRRK